MSTLSSYPVMLFKQFFGTWKEKPLTFPDPGWNITFPKHYLLEPPKKLTPLNTKGARILEAFTGESFYNAAYKHLFIARYQLSNSMSSSIISLDDMPELQWKAQNDKIFNAHLKLIYQEYKEYAGVHITTAAGLRQKGDIIFNTSDIIISTETRLLHTIRFYNTLYKNYGLNIYMNFTEDNIGEEMLDILRNSVFY
jgi:hypothetical protein